MISNPSAPNLGYDDRLAPSSERAVAVKASVYTQIEALILWVVEAPPNFTRSDCLFFLLQGKAAEVRLKAQFSRSYTGDVYTGSFDQRPDASVGDNCQGCTAADMARKLV